MRRTAFALALTLCAAPAFAQEEDVPVPAMDPQLIVQETEAASGGSMAVPLVLLTILAAAASS